MKSLGASTLSAITLSVVLSMAGCGGGSGGSSSSGSTDSAGTVGNSSSGGSNAVGIIRSDGIRASDESTTVIVLDGDGSVSNPGDLSSGGSINNSGTINGSISGSLVNASPVTWYIFATPPVNSQRIYTKTTLDNSSNTITQTVREIVTAVNADMSFDAVRDDPTRAAVIVAGTDYSIPTESLTLDIVGHELSYSSTLPNGTPASCTSSPHGGGLNNSYGNYWVAVGQGWTFDYAVTCGTENPVQYRQTSGAVAEIVSVLVPAGTFSTVRLQSTLIWTSQEGTTRTETITTWRDVATLSVVKEVRDISYSGTPLAHGYPVTVTMELQSQS